MNNIQRKFKSFLNTRSSKCIPLVTNNFGDVKFLFDSPIELVNKNNIFSVSLSDMIIPISLYMISDYFNNNKIYLTMNNIDYILTIPDGSCTSVELKNILITIFPETFSISYTSYKNIYTFTNSTYDFTLTNILCYQELGFYNNTSYNSTNKILSSIKPIDLSGSREIYIY